LGYSQEEMKKMRVDQLHSSQHWERVYSEFDSQRKGEKKFSADIPYLRKDGTTICADANLAMVEIDGKECGVAFFTDITDRRMAEIALKESEQRYKTLFDNAAEGIIVVQIGTRKILYSNPYACKMLGYTEDEMKNIRVEMFHTSRDWEHVLSEFESQSRGEKKVSMDIPYLRKDGAIVYADLNFAKVEIDTKECWVAFITDVTDRKMAEKALKDSEQRYRTLFENTVEGILVAEIETRKFTYANPAACKMLDYTQEELKTMHINQIHPPEDFEYVLSQFDAQARGEISLSTDIPCLRKDGKVIYADVNAAGGIIDGKQCMIGFFTDVTERKKAEKALKDSENRYKTLFENATEGILVADAETKTFIYANPGICKMLGYTEKELTGMHLKGIHAEEDWEFVQSDFEDLVRGQRSLSANIPCLRKDGTTVLVDINTSKIVIDGKKCNVGFFTDITEYRRMRNELENYKEKVLQVQKHAYINSVGSLVAHQINQPLTNISILIDRAVEQMQEESCCPEALQNAKNAIAEVKKTASIIHKFRKYSKDFASDTGEKVNVSDLADRIISILSQKAKQARMRIYTSGLKELNEIEFNETALEQVFYIIIQNAIEAADDEELHRLDIVGKFNNGEFELQFSDDCSGISPENIDRIFEPFFTTKTQAGRMGLGLDIVKQILIGYGGQIRAESEPGKGSTFYVTLSVDDAVKS
jgi:PAS domain S-box-containing protein